MYSNSVRELLYRISILICSMVRIMMVCSTLATSYNAIIMDRPPLGEGRCSTCFGWSSCFMFRVEGLTMIGRITFTTWYRVWLLCLRAPAEEYYNTYLLPGTWYLVPGTLPLVRYLVPGIEYHGLCANKYIPGTLVPFIANM